MQHAIMPILLLIGSNVFMTFAWYGHLRYKGVALGTVILVSWLIALPEYILQVPANRLGHGYYSAAQLKTIQEIITLSNHLVAFGLLIAAAWFMFLEPPRR